MRRSLLVLVLTLCGCAPGNPGLVIGNVVAADDQCTFTPTGAAQLGGVFDVGIPNNSYEATFRFVNQLLNLSQTGSSGFPVMSDPNQIQVQSLEVELRDIGQTPLALAGLPNPFTIPVGGVLVPSGDGEMAGESLGSARIIPAAYTAELAAVAGADAIIIVAVTAIGTSLGDAEVVSTEFIFPIELCSGCLTACLMDDEGMPLCVPTCRPGQDEIHIACDASCVVGAS